MPMLLLHSIFSLQTTAWMGTGILTIMAVVHFVLVVLYIRHCRQQGRESGVPYSHLKAEATDQEESKTEKAVAV